MENKSFFHLWIALLSVFLVAGCTSSKEAPAPTEPTPVAETKPAPEVAAPEAAAPEGPVMLAEVADNVVELGAGDDMKYDANEIRVEHGKNVTVNLKHSGKLPAAQMGHNFVLLRKGVDLTQFALKAMNASETEYIPAGDDVIAYTKIIGGGESTSVTFEAPEPGTYEFLCTFPGHFGVMQGKFVVS
jgi:azurin